MNEIVKVERTYGHYESLSSFTHPIRFLTNFTIATTLTCSPLLNALPWPLKAFISLIFPRNSKPVRGSGINQLSVATVCPTDTKTPPYGAPVRLQFPPANVV